MDVKTYPLWPDDHPEVRELAPDQRPIMEVYPSRAVGAPDSGTRVLVVFPGGGYGMLAGHEGGPVADWFTAWGGAAVVVRYRVAPHRFPAALRDAARAVRLVRKCGLDGAPVRHVTAIGFSAGGHLVGSLATLGDDAGIVDDPELAGVSPIPDSVALAYPVVTLSGPAAHDGSARNLFGPDVSAAQREVWSVERRVRPDTPRTFIWHTADDAAVPVVNALLLAEALTRNGVEVSLNVFPTGRHGLGLVHGSTSDGGWADLLRTWLS